jgi:Transposase
VVALDLPVRSRFRPTAAAHPQTARGLPHRLLSHPTPVHAPDFRHRLTPISGSVRSSQPLLIRDDESAQAHRRVRLRRSDPAGRGIGRDRQRPHRPGESPGVSIGSGLDGIDGLGAGDPVTAEQMPGLVRPRHAPTGRGHDAAWWPAILVALTEGVSNARTEGFNRIIKQTKRVGCGYRNMINYQRRIPEPHCGHPTAEISSMKRDQTPLNS